jgi:hypothetical protein
MSKYSEIEIWRHFEELNKKFLRCGYYWEMDVRTRYPYVSDGKPPPCFWDHTNQRYEPMTDEVLDTVMASTEFDNDLYHLLHTCFGVSAEVAFVTCLVGNSMDNPVL